MKTRFARLLIVCAALAATILVGCRRGGDGKAAPGVDGTAKGEEMIERIVRTEAEWKELLTPEQFRITRRKGTEPPFSSALNSVKEKGVFKCVSCDLDLFSSAAKYDSGTGWPSFYEPINAKHVTKRPDNSLFMRRTEALCARCGAHLGHVFDDGPEPTGLRYCLNGLALKFAPEDGRKVDSNAGQ